MKDFLNWSGMMTIPRELQIKNEKIYQSPVRELENYHKNLIKYEQCKTIIILLPSDVRRV